MKKSILLLMLFITTLCCYSQKGKHVVEYHYKQLKKSEGYYLKNKQHGVWKYWNMEGDLEKVETYSNGRLNGTYLEFKTVLFFNNRLNIIEYWEDNYEYFLRKQNNQKDFDTVVAGNYLDYEKDGEWTFFENSQFKWKYTYRNDKKNGLAVRYSYGALDISEEYKDDLKHGICTDYYWDKDIHTIETFEYGRKNGLSFLYDYDGNLIRTCSYKNDTLHGESYDSIISPKTYKVIRRSYDHGILDGKYSEKNTEYNETKFGNYQNGKKQGEWYAVNDYKEEMYTYNADTLSGKYYFHAKNVDPETFSEYGITNLDEVTSDKSGFMNIIETITTGEYFNHELHSENIYNGDSVLIASYILSNYTPVGRYELYVDGHLFVRGHYSNHEMDSIWTYYDSNGRVTQIRKYRSEHMESDYGDYDYSSLYYHIKKYPNGKTEFEYDQDKSIKKIYWPSGNLHAMYWTNMKGGLTYRENIYNKDGNLCSYREYLLDASLHVEKKYCSIGEDDLSILYDTHFGYFGIVEEIVEAPMIEEEMLFAFVEEQAEFPGGVYNLIKYIKEHFNTSTGAGEIEIDFIVNKDGAVGDVKLMKDEVGNGNGIEFAKTVMGLPTFKPARRNGKPIANKFRATCTMSKWGDVDYDITFVEAELD